MAHKTQQKRHSSAHPFAFVSCRGRRCRPLLLHEPALNHQAAARLARWPVLPTPALVPPPLPPGAPAAAGGRRGAAACGACCRTLHAAALPRRGGAARGGGAPAGEVKSMAVGTLAPAGAADPPPNWQAPWLAAPLQARQQQVSAAVRACLQRMRLAGLTRSSLDTRSFASALTAVEHKWSTPQELGSWACQLGSVGGMQTSKPAGGLALPRRAPRQPSTPLSHSGPCSDNLPCRAQQARRGAVLLHANRSTRRREEGRRLQPVEPSTAACRRAHLYDFAQQLGL